jgi:hypothetical protein
MKPAAQIAERIDSGQRAAPRLPVPPIGGYGIRAG